MKDDRLYLIHIHECIARIQAYSKGGREEFLESTLIQDAVLRNLQTLTESTQRLSPQLKAKHSHLDWRGMASFRNVLVHRYLGINIERVWQLMDTELPGLKATIDKLLKKGTKPRRKSPRGAKRSKKRKT
jgi:uncharacterized protein with HEPN domain